MSLIDLIIDAFTRQRLCALGPNWYFFNLVNFSLLFSGMHRFKLVSYCKLLHRARWQKSTSANMGFTYGSSVSYIGGREIELYFQLRSLFVLFLKYVRSRPLSGLIWNGKYWVMYFIIRLQHKGSAWDHLGWVQHILSDFDALFLAHEVDWKPHCLSDKTFICMKQRSCFSSKPYGLC